MTKLSIFNSQSKQSQTMVQTNCSSKSTPSWRVSDNFDREFSENFPRKPCSHHELSKESSVGRLHVPNRPVIEIPPKCPTFPRNFRSLPWGHVTFMDWHVMCVWSHVTVVAQVTLVSGPRSSEGPPFESGFGYQLWNHWINTSRVIVRGAPGVGRGWITRKGKEGRKSTAWKPIRRNGTWDRRATRQTGRKYGRGRGQDRSSPQVIIICLGCGIFGELLEDGKYDARNSLDFGI